MKNSKSIVTQDTICIVFYIQERYSVSPADNNYDNSELTRWRIFGVSANGQV